LEWTAPGRCTSYSKSVCLTVSKLVLVTMTYLSVTKQHTIFHSYKQAVHVGCWPRLTAAIEEWPSRNQLDCVASAPAPSSSTTTPTSPELRPSRSSQTTTSHKFDIFLRTNIHSSKINNQPHHPVRATPWQLATPPSKGHVQILTNQRWRKVGRVPAAFISLADMADTGWDTDW